MTQPQALADVGEFGLIDMLTATHTPGPQITLGVGDDAAVVASGNGLAVCTDVLVEGVHFRTEWSEAIDVGRKAIAVNISDLNAVGARAVAVLLGLAAPASTPVTWLRFLAQGIAEECERVGAALIGGDVTASATLTLAVTALGEVPPSGPVTRSGAQVGDDVAVCGRLGLAAAGLDVLRGGFRSPRAAVAAHRVPQVPYGAGPAVAGLATAMIDVSDGLLADLNHIAEASAVGIDIDTALLDIPDEVTAVARARGADPLGYVLGGGEDHALAATFAAGRVPATWRRIGTVTDSAGVVVDSQPWDASPGWRHFG